MEESSGEPDPGRRAGLRISSYLQAAVLYALILCSPAAAFDLEERVREFTLDNGLRVLFLERRGAPIFAAHIAFKVGSVEERSGYTGAAHMLEHMLFKGTTTIGTKDWEKEKPLLEKVWEIGDKLDSAKREGAPEEEIKELREKLAEAQREQKKYVISDSYSKIYTAEGGVGFNAGTSKDLTTYIIRLPANKLELWAWIESDRMRDAVMREYYAERDVVMEERRRSYENRPQGKLYERFLSAAFIASPYGWPIIGWESDIAVLPLGEVKRFWDTWYAPNNAVIAIVGDLDFENVKKTIEKYFGPLPARPLPVRRPTKEPPQGGERRIEVVFDANPSFMMGFHKPTFPEPDDYVFSVIDSILSQGRTSRFYRNIVEKKKVAVSVGTFTVPGSRHPNLFTIAGEPMPPHTTMDVEEAVWDELERLKTEPVPEKELEKVINNMEADFIRGLVSHYGMARLLTYYQQVTGDWREVLREMERIKAVTPEDIIRVAEKYFTKDNMTVATLTRSEEND
ncbi:MAG: M16 family metallopeptidase [Candidatus Nitrospinota bacterium M3_3B_026]